MNLEEQQEYALGLVHKVEETLSAPGVYRWSLHFTRAHVDTICAFSPRHARLLAIFAAGTFGDYHEHMNEFPALSLVALTKLRQLTILRSCSLNKPIHYSALCNLLFLPTDHVSIELLVWDAIKTHGLFRGVLDDRRQQFTLTLNQCFPIIDPLAFLLPGDHLSVLVNRASTALSEWKLHIQGSIRLLTTYLHQFENHVKKHSQQEQAEPWRSLLTETTKRS